MYTGGRVASARVLEDQVDPARVPEVAVEPQDVWVAEVRLTVRAHECDWNGTNGGVINGGVSQKKSETCKIGRICAKLAGFARNLREICTNLRKFAQIVFAKFTQICAKFTALFVTVPFVPI